MASPIISFINTILNMLFTGSIDSGEPWISQPADIWNGWNFSTFKEFFSYIVQHPDELLGLLFYFFVSVAVFWLCIVKPIRAIVRLCKKVTRV